VWNAETGDPLTPPLRHPTGLTSAVFLADGRRIVTTDMDGHHWLWELPVDERPEEDIQKLGRLLSADTVTPAGVRAARQSEPLSTLWQRLQASYPANFTASTREIATWHESAAKESEKQGEWVAAACHWKQLLALRPDDPAPREHLSLANRRSQKGD
jgi:hypothetical protein